MNKEGDKPYKHRNTIEGEEIRLSNKIRRYLSVAQNVASYSDYGKIRHGAVLVKGGSILNTAFNKDKFSSFGERFRAQGVGPATHHAELSCVTGLNKSKTSGASIFVVRLNRTGELRLSKPCPMCHDVLKFTGVKKVYYSTNDGSIEMYKL
jgi:tRNA(Arg) A34 adenosine deaminase TadA